MRSYHSNGSLIDQIKQSVTMMEVCDKYGIKLNRAGFASCPFHVEKSASMKVYPGDRGWHCFGCGAGGDVIEFVQLLFGITTSDTIKRIDSDFGLNLIYGNVNVEKAKAERNLKQEARQRFESEYDAKVTEARLLRGALKTFDRAMIEEQAVTIAQINARLEYLDYWFEENPWREYTLNK